MELSLITYTVEDGVARVTLNRPDVMNAFNKEMHAQLAFALDDVKARNDVRALVLSGAGKAFCTGQDLEERRVPEGESMPDLGLSLKERYNPLIERIAAFEFPVICAVNGAAVGAGAGLALACDIVVAAKSALFMFPFNQLGLVPDSGATWSLVRAIGLPRAKAAIHLSEKITAQQAEDWGMIWKCVDDELLQETVDGYLKRILKQPTIGMALTKKALNVSMQNSLTEQLALESESQRIAGASPEYRERVMAFLNRKK